MARSRTRSRGARSRSGGGGGSPGLTRNLGMLALAIWLVLAGLNALMGLNFPEMGQLMAFFALAAGLLLLLRR